MHRGPVQGATSVWPWPWVVLPPATTCPQADTRENWISSSLKLDKYLQSGISTHLSEFLLSLVLGPQGRLDQAGNSFMISSQNIKSMFPYYSRYCIHVCVCVCVCVYKNICSPLSPKKVINYLTYNAYVWGWKYVCCVLSCFSCASLPGSSIHGILRARKLEWVAMPSSRGSKIPTQGLKPHLLHLLHLQAGSLPLAPPVYMSV